MKKVVSMAMVLLTAMSVTAETKTVEAKLTDAVVFLNGAELQQQATLNLKKGENEVRIEGLAPQVNRNSLQVSLSNGVVVSAFDYGVDYLSADKSNERIRPLQDSLNIYEAQLRPVESELQTIKKMQELLLAGVDHSMQVERQNITNETIEKNLNYYQKRALQLTEQQSASETRKAHINERITALKKQIKQDNTDNARRSGILNLTLYAPQAGSAKAKVKYFTGNAYWTPFYDLQVSEVGKPVNLNLKAHVAQTTGLDWQQVHLVLSTGTPSKSNSLPSFSPWRLSQQVIYSYQSRNMMASKAVVLDKAMATADSEGVYEEEADIYSQGMGSHIQQSEQALMLEYDIDLPYTILGNGKEQTIALAHQQADNVEYVYRSLPKLDGSVYLTAEIKNWEQLSLLDGMANITMGDTYFGQTYINASSTDESIRLTLGDDPQLSIKREKLSQLSKTKTVGSNQSVTQTYKITVRNNKKQSVKISVEEQYPVSTAKEIQVSLGDNTTRWTKNDTEKGVLTYDVELPAGGTQELIVSYTIKYPKDWTINL